MKYLLVAGSFMLFALPCFAELNHISSHDTFQRKQEAARIHSPRPKILSTQQAVSFQAHPPLKNRFYSRSTAKNVIPKKSRGFFYGSSGSMTLQSLRSRSRHSHVL